MMCHVCSFSWKGYRFSIPLRQKQANNFLAIHPANPCCLVHWEHHKVKCYTAGLRVWNKVKAATLETSPLRLDGETPAAWRHQGKSLNHLLLAHLTTFMQGQGGGGVFRKSGLVVPCPTRPASKNSSEVTGVRTQCASPFLRSKASDKDSTSAPLTHYPEVGSVLDWTGRVLACQRRVALHTLIVKQVTHFILSIV